MAEKKWKNPVQSQMGGKAPSMTNANAVLDHNPCPQFSKPHDVGNGGIPLKFQETVNGHGYRSEEHTSELQSHSDLVCRLLLEKKKKLKDNSITQRKKDLEIIDHDDLFLYIESILISF